MIEFGQPTAHGNDDPDNDTYERGPLRYFERDVAIISITHAPVRIPSICPNCDADLEDPEDELLTACGWMAVEQTAKWAEDGPDWDDGTTEDFYEVQEETGWKCGSCGHLLAGSET